MDGENLTVDRMTNFTTFHGNTHVYQKQNCSLKERLSLLLVGFLKKFN